MGEFHSHQFRPVRQVWLRGDEEQELCCECGEKLWVTFESSTLAPPGLMGRFRKRLDRFGRLNTL